MILGCLRRDDVAHTISGIEPVRRAGLETSAGRDQQAAGDIALRQPDVLRLGTVHIDQKMRIVERLLNMQVGRAGHVADVLQQPIDKVAIALQVVANHLDINGRRETKVKNLRHHVHGQGIERSSGELGSQLRAEALHVGIRGMVLFRQGHGDVGVGAPDDTGAGVGEIQPANRGYQYCR